MLAATRMVRESAATETTKERKPPQMEHTLGITPPLEADRESTAPAPTEQERQWGELVRRIQQGEERAVEELYHLFSKGIRYYLCRQLGAQELDDKVHDTFLIVLQAIRRGEIREPERLMGFVRTVVRRQVAAYIGHAVQSRKEYTDLDAGSRVADEQASPEQTAIVQQSVEIMKTVLRGVSDRDREILTRFYLQEQSQERICADMNLTDTQFRLLKSRAKARFGELGKRRVDRTKASEIPVRGKSASAH